MTCPLFDDIRKSHLCTIKTELSHDSYSTFESLNHHLKLLVLLGLEFPKDKEDLYILRCISCVHVHMMKSEVEHVITCIYVVMLYT